MAEFVLDTSGYPPGIPGGHDWRELDGFTQGYIEAMFFTEQDRDHDMEDYGGLVGPELELTPGEAWGDSAQGSIPSDAGFRHLSGEALEAILKDCTKFHEGPAWRAVTTVRDREEGTCWDQHFPDETQGGRDFWYTRNGHGAGFWDGDWPEPHGTALTEASKAFGEVNPYWVPTPYDRDADAGDWEATGEVCL